MDEKILLAIIISILIFIMIILFALSIPVFSFILYKRISKDMSLSNKSVFDLMLIFINLFIIAGTYFFIFRDMNEYHNSLSMI